MNKPQRTIKGNELFPTKFRIHILMKVILATLLISAWIFGKPLNFSQAASNNRVLLPLIANNSNVTGNTPFLLLGLYARGWLGDQTVVDQQMNELSDWSGVKLTFAGTFTEIREPNYDAAINQQFGKMYSNGYTPFINILPKISAYQYAKGDADQYIRQWARAFKQVVQGGNRVAYIALMPEMNGNWVPYGYDPENYKLALRRTQTIFMEEGVPKDSVRWVFAPNGWSAEDHKFEKYYPGDEFVDAIGFSAYNYGYCSYANYTPQWNSLESITKEYIDRIRVMAPSKPIFLAQVATSAKTHSGVSDAAKNQWFREGYEFLLKSPGVRGVIYFNIDDDICDMAMWRTWQTTLTKSYQGYKDVVKLDGVQYLRPEELYFNQLSP